MTVSKVRPSWLRCSASATSKRALSPRSAALARARAMAVGDTSTPTTSALWAAASSAFSPVPQPASRRWPRSAPRSASRTNAGCGRPTSQGGGVPATYTVSQSRDSVTTVLLPPCEAGLRLDPGRDEVMAEADERGLGFGGPGGEQDLLAPVRVGPFPAQRPARALHPVDAYAAEASLLGLGQQAVRGVKVGRGEELRPDYGVGVAVLSVDEVLVD